MRTLLHAAIIAAGTIGLSGIALADSCSSHAATCTKLCTVDIKDKCKEACQGRLEQCKQTGIYTDATGKKHTVTDKD